MKLEFTSDVTGGWLRLLVVPLQFGLERGNDATARPLHRSLPGAVVVNRTLRDSQDKKPLTGEITPCGNELKNSHGWTLKENCEIRKKRMDELRNPQHSPYMKAKLTKDANQSYTVTGKSGNLAGSVQRVGTQKKGSWEVWMLSSPPILHVSFTSAKREALTLAERY